MTSHSSILLLRISGTVSLISSSLARIVHEGIAEEESEGRKEGRRKEGNQPTTRSQMYADVEYICMQTASGRRRMDSCNRDNQSPSRRGAPYAEIQRSHAKKNWTARKQGRRNLAPLEKQTLTREAAENSLILTSDINCFNSPNYASIFQSNVSLPTFVDLTTFCSA